ncbi:hypothetical protein [Neorhizobium tunisiense]|uniref:hypothetical protein n=1 Tax=Neorhizobium tunisiense TaxID=3144793 RepID=UPI00404776E1
MPLIDELGTGCRPDTPNCCPVLRSPKRFDYMLKRWDGLTSFRYDGWICLTTNAARHALRGFAPGSHLVLRQIGSWRGPDLTPLK